MVPPSVVRPYCPYALRKETEAAVTYNQDDGGDQPSWLTLSASAYAALGYPGEMYVTVGNNQFEGPDA